MVAQTLHGSLHIIQIYTCIMRMLCVASHPELLPYQESHLVAELVEIVRLSNAATPQTDEVDTRLLRHAQFGIHALIIAAEHCLGQPVRTAHEYLFAVHIELSRLIRSVSVRCHLANTETRVALVAHFAVYDNFHVQVIHLLSALVQRPPQTRVLDHQLAEFVRAETYLACLTAKQFYILAEVDVCTFNLSAHRTFHTTRGGVCYLHTHGLLSLVICRM